MVLESVVDEALLISPTLTFGIRIELITGSGLDLESEFMIGLGLELCLGLRSGFLYQCSGEERGMFSKWCISHIQLMISIHEEVQTHFRRIWRIFQISIRILAVMFLIDGQGF